ncbi:MAG: RNA 2',3'-cyclic phosphodiesterase [Candidatus Eisenbacteria bacterium]|nr:RNA 2',3'-cyclic phosphodiesterase [Candidatus Eisenbacteria bacterium]
MASCPALHGRRRRIARSGRVTAEEGGEMAATIRTFIALCLPERARSAAATCLSDLRGRAPRGDLKWVAPENLHVTVRFLGDRAPADVTRAAGLIEALHGDFDAVPTAWSELGAFPSPRRPQVIWLGLADPEARLRALVRRIDERLHAAGFGRADKTFRAHVTLGRVRRGRRVGWASLSDGLTTPSTAFSIRTAALFKSTLTREGPIYAPLARAEARTARA